MAVDKDLRVSVYAFKLQEHRPIRPLCRSFKGFLIDIVPAHEPPRVDPAGGLRRAGLREHGVVGKGDGDGPVLLPQGGDSPVFTEK